VIDRLGWEVLEQRAAATVAVVEFEPRCMRNYRTDAVFAGRTPAAAAAAVGQPVHHSTASAVAVQATEYAEVLD
jgi:hypothetical protein